MVPAFLLFLIILVVVITALYLNRTKGKYEPRPEPWPEPKPKPKPIGEQESLESVYARVNSKWVCMYCETINDNSSNTCRACGHRKS